MVQEFLEHKKRTETYMNQRDDILKRWQYSEEALALKSPVMEAEYAYDDKTTLSLYDCTVPKIKEHRRLILPQDYKETILDYRAKTDSIRIEQDLFFKKKRQWELENERDQLKDKVKILEE